MAVRKRKRRTIEIIRYETRQENQDKTRESKQEKTRQDRTGQDKISGEGKRRGEDRIV